MKELFYSIDPEIFSKFPGFVRGVVLAYDVQNGPSSPDLIELLRSEEAAVRQRLTIETLTEQPRIKAWREAFRSLGIKPSEFRSSIEAMTRRALRSDPLPSINALVDIGNIISLRYLIPAGGHSMDGLTQDISLRLADGTEDFVAFGSDELEHPNPGEIVFVEGPVVLTRRWVWRQSQHTLTLPETRSIEMNIDLLPPASANELDGINQDLMSLISQYCGGTSRAEILSADHPKISLAQLA
ncbi:MAG: phenylalanine--tRNA ligase beta subunit-related protein [Anaerolineaceae bacterium]|nr:phenylalanine--tRNA ligase beta subunit-related protein [Anaerolineaceae bacterium]